MGMTRGPSTKRIKDLVALARSLGVKHLRAGEVEFDLLPESNMGKTVDKDSTGLETVNERLPTEDEMLLYSTGFYDSVRSERAEAAKPQS